MARPALPQPFCRWYWYALHHVSFYLEAWLLSRKYAKEVETLRLIRKVKRECDLMVTAGEAFFLYSLVQKQCRIAGELAEVGVYKGGTARLICEAKGSVPLHLFDTFHGLPEPSRDERAVLQRGTYAGELDLVQSNLRGYENVFFYPGRFPATSAPVADRTFSFVHLDADLYQSMVDGLEFFYPRLSAGGVIVTHDYMLPGVKRALAECFADRWGQVIEMSTSQCLVIRRQ